MLPFSPSSRPALASSTAKICIILSAAAKAAASAAPAPNVRELSRLHPTRRGRRHIRLWSRPRHRLGHKPLYSIIKLKRRTHSDGPRSTSPSVDRGSQQGARAGVDCVEAEAPTRGGPGLRCALIIGRSVAGTRCRRGRVGLSKLEYSQGIIWFQARKPDRHSSVGLLSAWGLMLE